MLNRKSLKSRGKDIFESNRLSDCEFCFTEPGEPTKIVSANRAILALSSSVFETMFYGSLPESNTKPVKIEDIDYDAFKTFLQYIYTRELHLESIDEAIKLFYAARKYDVCDIEDICEAYLYTKIEPQNVCQIFEFGKLFEKPELREICLTVIRAKTNEVFASTGFLEADLNTVMTIFEQDELFINSELELFDALNRYAVKNNLLPKSDEDRKKFTDVVSKETESTSASKSFTQAPTIYDAVRKIRYLTISGADFASEPMRSELLSQQEKLAILSNLVASTSAFYPMPEGFTQDNSVRGDRMIICKLRKLQTNYPNARFSCPHDGNESKSSIDYILFSCTQFSSGRQKMINCFKEDGVSENLSHVLEKNKPASLRALCKYIKQHELDIKYLKDY